MTKNLKDLDALRAFVRVVELGSINAAAESLSMPRTTVRRKLQELEATVGSTLLHRTADGARPTDKGQRLAVRGAAVLSAADGLFPEIEQDDDVSGVVRVALPVGTPAAPTSMGMAILRAQFPDLEFRVWLCQDPKSMLPSDVDFAISFADPARTGPNIVSVALRARLHLLASSVYLATHGVPETLEDLATHSVALWAPEPGRPPRLPLIAGGSLAVDPIYVTNDVTILRSLAAQHHAIVTVPDALVDFPGDAPLVPVLPEIVRGEVPVWFMTPEAVSRSPRVRTVVEAARAALMGIT